MSLTNTRETYGWLTIALHWIAAIGVVAMFATGLRADWLGEHDRELHAMLLGQHIALGGALFAIFALRIIAHYVQQRPEKPPQAKWMNTLSVAVQHLLLLGILIQIISGPLAVWSNARAINIFDVIAIPSPFAEKNHDLHELAETLHVVGRATIFFALILHLAGVAKHLIIDRDGVLRRMLWPSKL